MEALNRKKALVEEELRDLERKRERVQNDVDSAVEVATKQRYTHCAKAASQSGLLSNASVFA